MLIYNIHSKLKGLPGNQEIHGSKDSAVVMRLNFLDLFYNFLAEMYGDKMLLTFLTSPLITISKLTSLVSSFGLTSTELGKPFKLVDCRIDRLCNSRKTLSETMLFLVIGSEFVLNNLLEVIILEAVELVVAFGEASLVLE